MRIGKQVLIKQSSIEKNVATAIKGEGLWAALILPTANGMVHLIPLKWPKTFPIVFPT
jgi:hypothetical protein